MFNNVVLGSSNEPFEAVIKRVKKNRVGGWRAFICVSGAHLWLLDRLTDGHGRIELILTHCVA